MPRQRKPTIGRGPASAYAMPGQTIVEFSDEQGSGGLIALHRTPEGILSVQLYRLDENVRVSVDPANLAT